MAISSLGVGAGFDLASVLDALMAIERRPLDRIEAKQSTVDSQLSWLGKIKSDISSFKSSLSALRYAYNVETYSATSSNADVLSASSNSDATPSSYSINVSTLAAAHKVASSAYADANTVVGGGTLTIDVGGTSFDIAVSGTDTLSTIRDAINAASDNSGVTASIINEQSGSRLILTANETGASNAITFSVVDDDGNNTDTAGLSRLFSYGVGGDGLAETVTAAADAELTVDGFNITSASNSVSGVIDGVTLELKSTGSATVGVSTDSDALAEKLQGVVDAYNKLRKTLDDAQNGSLKNDSVIRSIKNGLASVLNETAGSGTFTHLTQIGVSRDRYGVMSLDKERLAEAVNTDFSSIVSLLSDSTSGIVSRLYTVSDEMLNEDGYVGGREYSLNSVKSYLATKNEQWVWRLEQIRKRYQEKFSALDTLVSSLQGANSFLNYQLSQ